ncbi:MAG: hypothetical protein IJO26_02710 [Clostridium sp.]|nr:hypothetical protein [Clostridium sp.]
MNNDIFVKLNYETIGEFKSLIVDRQHKDYNDSKYMICSGKYNKDGWTFVFKAKNLKEAQDFINKNSIKKYDLIDRREKSKTTLNKVENKVHIPTWIQKNAQHIC